MARLLSECNGLLAADFENDSVVQPRAAERILKRLAVRGLVRLLEGRWTLRPGFVNGMRLEKCAAA